MSVEAMLDRFIFIVKGSRVIDRMELDWGQFVWLDDKFVKSHVYSTADMRRYFGHRRTRFKDPFAEWMANPRRTTVATLTQAMQFADRAARGLVAPRIDINSIIKKASAPSWVRAER
jgi:hypothetical protein